MVWLCDVWEKLAGTRPPLEAAVLVSAEPAAWPEAPVGRRLLAWHALRLTVLHAIWSARVADRPAERTPAAVARQVVAGIREEIQLQFRRSCQRQYNLQFLPPQLLGTHRLQPAADGFQIWRDIGLCTVLTSSAATSPGGAGHLVVLFSEAHPVPVPSD